uniref:DUF6216 family protein n=2 Tax=Cupriavidus taiwanensis TaxID=164546 RepID=UPI0011C06989
MFESVRTVHGPLAAMGISAAVLSAITLALLVWLRTKSTHSIMNRLWSLFDRKSKPSDEVVESLLKAQSSLMQFRFTTGLPVRTLAHVHRLDRWLRENEETVDTVKGCGSYFDLDKPALKAPEELPKNGKQVLLMSLSMLFVVATALLILGAMQSSAILKTKKSEVWFLLSNRSATLLWSDVSFGEADCSGDQKRIERSTKFEPAEISAVCEQLKLDVASAFVRETVQTQRILFCYLAAFMTLYAFMVGSYGVNGGNARAMSRRLHGKSQPASNVPGLSAF